MQKIHTLMSALAVSGLAATSASAVVINIDVGRDDPASGTITTDTGWNNLTNGAASGSFAVDFGITDMVDSTGAATSIDINVDSSGGGSWAGSGADFGGVAPAPFAGAPATATSDSMFIRATSVDIVVSDLTAGFTYDFLFWGARGNNGEVVDSDIIFTAVGGNGTFTGSYADSLNNSTVVSLSGLTADINGEITITYEGEDGGTSATSENGALNIIQITENVPEPGSLALLGLGGLALLRRRRA